MKTIRTKKIAVAGLAIAASMAAASPSHAATVTAALEGLQPFFTGSTLSLGGSPINGDVLGELNWQGQSSNPTPFTSTFNTYCLDLVDNIKPGDIYTFDLDPAISTAPAAGGPMGMTAALELQSLYANHFTTLGTDGDRIAFQLSIWSIVYNSLGQDSVDNPSFNFHVTSGVNTAVLAQADGWLSAADTAATTLTGPFDTSVVALLGEEVPGSGGDFAQDQVFVEDLPGNGIPTFGVPEINSSAAGSLALLLLGTLALLDSKRARRRA